MPFGCSSQEHSILCPTCVHLLMVHNLSWWQVIIGPATVGGIQAGAFKIGDTAGTLDNIIHCKLYRPGSVGFVSKSVRHFTWITCKLASIGGWQKSVSAKPHRKCCDLFADQGVTWIMALFKYLIVGILYEQGGMSNEMYNVLARVTDGLYEGIAIGGDVYPGSTLSDHVLRFNNIPQVMLLCLIRADFFFGRRYRTSPIGGST